MGRVSDKRRKIRDVPGREKIMPGNGMLVRRTLGGTEMTNHTQTPWHYYSQNKEDIAFVVRAVNAHEELVQAAKYALQFVEVSDARQRLDQAIAKAEGRS